MVPGVAPDLPQEISDRGAGSGCDFGRSLQEARQGFQLPLRVEGNHHFAILQRCKDHLIGRPRIALIAIAIDLLSQSTKTKWIKSTELREE